MYAIRSYYGSGSSNINNYNGALTYIHDDVSNNTNINNFTISHVYNTYQSWMTDQKYGKGWHINMCQTLKPISWVSSPQTKFEYTDADGARHYFVDVNGSIIDRNNFV